DPHGVPVQGRVEVALHPPAQWFVDEERHCERNHDKRSDGDRHHAEPANTPAARWGRRDHPETCRKARMLAPSGLAPPDEPRALRPLGVRAFKDQRRWVLSI